MGGFFQNEVTIDNGNRANKFRRRNPDSSAHAGTEGRAIRIERTGGASSLRERRRIGGVAMHSLITCGVEMPIEIQRVQPDRGKIELTNDAVARHWLKTFGVSREALEAAIAKVGPNPDTVKKELARQAASASDQTPLPK